MAAHRPLSWAAASAVVAILIDPIVDVLDRKLPRIASVLIALLVVTAGTWGAIYVAADDLNTGVDRLGEAAQDAAAELEERGDSIGQAARDVELTRRVDSFVEALDERVMTGGEDVLALDRRHGADVLPGRHPHPVPDVLRPGCPATWS